MKPILVENVKQLNDLLPVLRKRVKVDFEDIHGLLSEKGDRMLYVLEKGLAIVLYFYRGRFDSILYFDLAVLLPVPTQSVSEYIQSNSPEIEGVESAGEVTDWEAKYKELEKKYNDTAAGDALYQTEMKILVQENDKLRAENERLKQRVQDLMDRMI